MGQSEKNENGVGFNNNTSPATEMVLEFKLANEFNNIISIDLEELIAYEKDVRNLHLELSMAKTMEQIAEIEARFAELRVKLNEVIKNYKSVGIESISDKIPTADVGKSLGHYKDEKENEFLIAKITHQSFDIPVVIEKLISLELVKDILEQRIDEKKMVINNPEKKWEVAEAKSFNISKEAFKMKETFEQQEKYIELVKKGIVEATADKEVNEHLKGIETLTKKAGIAIDAYGGAEVNLTNVIGLSVAIGMINNLIRGLRKVITLTEGDGQINHVSYEEEVKNHLHDYTLIDAVNMDGIHQLEKARVEIDKLFGNMTNQYPIIIGIVGEMIRITDTLKKKEKRIYEAKFNLNNQ